MHQLWQLACIIRTQQQVQVIGHQTHHLHLACNLLLGFGEHCQQHISSDALGHQKLTAVAAQGDLETKSQQESFAVGVPKGIRHRDLNVSSIFPIK